MNQLILAGNVGKTPELRESKNGKSYLNISIASNEAYTNKSGEKVQTTEWHQCRLFGERAKSLSGKIVKGQMLGLSGALKYWRTDEGNDVAYMNISSLEFLGKKPESNEEIPF